MSETPIDERLRQLEAVVSEHAGTIEELRGEVVDAGGLVTQVQRLSEGTESLDRTITRLDQQQTDISTLGRQVALARAKAERVARETPTHEDVEAKARKLRAERRRTGRRVTLSIITVALVFGAGLAYSTNVGYHACADQMERINIHISLYDDIVGDARGTTADRIRAGAEALKATTVDCDAVYPIHWGDTHAQAAR